jgi:hypothetical protein
MGVKKAIMTTMSKEITVACCSKFTPPYILVFIILRKNRMKKEKGSAFLEN